MEKLKVKERERITHRDIALGSYKDLPVDVFRAERGGKSTQTVFLSHQKKKRVVLLS
jgi:hypothetical protein